MAREKQVRGDNLRNKIAAEIRRLAAEAKAAGKPYTYNATRLAVAVGTTRPTLAKHDDFIQQTLKSLNAQKRMENGEGVVQLLREKIERLETEKESLRKELEVLRNHHAEIYRSIYYRAGDLEPLIRPIVEEEMFEADRCILCHHEIEEIDTLEPMSPKPSNVIKLPRRETEGHKPKRP